MEKYPNNDQLFYELHQFGNGISASNPETEIIWYMNKYFRCGLEKDAHGHQKVFDFTRYTRDYSEPQEMGQRNWSIMDLINQKGTRPKINPLESKSLINGRIFSRISDQKPNS